MIYTGEQMTWEEPDWNLHEESKDAAIARGKK
jgi:hypothetical protein